MKFYIVSDTESGMDNHDGLYYLISETGEMIGGHICSNRSFAMNDLFFKNKKNKKICEELANGSTVEVLYLGRDSMTNSKLHQLVKKNLEEEFYQN